VELQAGTAPLPVDFPSDDDHPMSEHLPSWPDGRASSITFDLERDDGQAEQDEE
jgi:hypothetical protein